MKVKLAVSGCRGRMGGRILALASSDKRFQVVAGLEHAGHPDLGKNLGEVSGTGVQGVRITDDVTAGLKQADCLIEFTSPQATLDHLAMAVKHGKGMVIGTTGLDDGQVVKIKDASKKIPIVFAPNMSVGVNALFANTEAMLRTLEVKKTETPSKGKGANMIVRIVETHHEHKKDKPSGTAKHLAEIVKRVSGGYELVLGKGIQSLREGEVVGEHTIIFENEFEELQLIHKAKSRDVFAWGALRAAEYVCVPRSTRGGLFDMQHVLGIKS